MSKFVDHLGNVWYDEGDLLIHKTYGWICKYEGLVIANNRRHYVVRRADDNQRLVLPEKDWDEYVEKN